MLKHTKYLLINGIFVCSILPAATPTAPVVTEMKKTVPCASVKALITDLTNGEYKESPYWMGDDANSRYVLMVNLKTKTWTFMQYNEKTSCILGTGSNHVRLFNGPKT